MNKRVNLMVASTVGTTLEWYDFFAFAMCAVLVFDKLFYNTADPFMATLLALGTFAAGFLARPLGGIIFGILGDKIGRKHVLVVSLLMMGFGTFAVGLLPTYETIGIAAPILLLVLRIVQGIAVGGEATGAILIISESMPSHQRAFWTSFTMFAGPLANVLAAMVILIVQRIYGDQGFLEWAWRIPFFLSALLVFLGFWTRRKVEESPEFIAIKSKREHVEHAPLKESFVTSWRRMLTAFFLKASENTFLYIFSTFLVLMATTYLGFSRGPVMNAILWASLVEVIVVLFAAAAADKFGRRPILLIGLGLSAISSFALFTLKPGETSQTELQLFVILCLASHGVILGAMAAFMAELFPTRIRFTALSTSYQLASVAGGSIAPILGAILLKVTGSGLAVAIYATVMSIPALIAVLRTPETRDNPAVEPDAPAIKAN
ncbi:MFS transporter [Brevundimonas sp.]|uniref:MFS transporter n=1 Tax=Brevundimonas sp. TaxID=1871086 RepID=UPI00289C0849|nr:MFS transporter [Brevundimonas sp.]